MDSGATVMCSSILGAEEIQMQRINREEPGTPTIRDSDRRFRLADGSFNDSSKMVEQPIIAGLLSGKTVNMHLIDRSGNDTSPLFSIDEMRRLRMVVDYEENKVMFKDNPDVWHTLPTTKEGLMMTPLTKEACEKTCNHAAATKAHSTGHSKKEAKRKSLTVAGCSCEGPVVCHHGPISSC